MIIEEVGGVVKCECDLCGEFFSKKKRFLKGKRQFCCTDCYHKHDNLLRHGSLSAKANFVCDLCHKEFESYISAKNGKNYYCCSAHANEHQSVVNSGPNNANFGKPWTDERKAAQAERARNASIETRKMIGRASSLKFQKEGYMDRWRQTMEDAGWWRTPENYEEFEFYRKESHWCYVTWAILKKIPENAALLKEFGVYSVKKNPTGVSRDHMYSRYAGFENSVFPDILRHPANLKLLQQNKNRDKGRKSSIELEELFELIKNYEGFWFEQELVINSIERYKNGERWSKE